MQERLPDGEALLAGAPAGATRIDAMLALIRGGTSPRQAAIAVGVTSSTWQRWMVEGDVDPSEGWGPRNERAPAHVRQFWQHVERARAGWIARLSLQVTSGVPRNIAEGRRILRRVDPDEPAWWTDADEPPASPPSPVVAQSVERQVMVLPEEARAMLRLALRAESVDDAEHADDSEAALASMSEIVVPDGVARNRL
jgi:hypothetical protein